MQDNNRSARPGAANAGARSTHKIAGKAKTLVAQPLRQRKSDDKIDGAALFLPHTLGHRNHLVTVRRNPAPRRNRSWLARYFALDHEFAITARQLRDPVRFGSVASHALRRRVRDDGELLRSVVDLVNFDGPWQRNLDAMMARIGGTL